MRRLDISPPPPSPPSRSFHTICPVYHYRWRRGKSGRLSRRATNIPPRHSSSAIAYPFGRVHVEPRRQRTTSRHRLQRPAGSGPRRDPSPSIKARRGVFGTTGAFDRHLNSCRAQGDVKPALLPVAGDAFLTPPPSPTFVFVFVFVSLPDLNVAFRGGGICVLYTPTPLRKVGKASVRYGVKVVWNPLRGI